jgi:hypothetical protein
MITVGISERALLTVVARRFPDLSPDEFSIALRSRRPRRSGGSFKRGIEMLNGRGPTEIGEPLRITREALGKTQACFLRGRGHKPECLQSI